MAGLEAAYDQVATALAGKMATFVIVSASIDGLLTAQLLKAVVNQRGSSDNVNVILVAAAEQTPVAYCGGANGCYNSVLTGAIAFAAASGAPFATVETSQWFKMGRNAPQTVSADLG